MFAVSADVSSLGARHALSRVECKHAHIRRGALLAVSVLHGAVRLVPLEFDDAGHVVCLQSFLEDGCICQRVDLSSLYRVVSRDGHLAVGEHLALGGGRPGLLVEQFGVSFGSLDVQGLRRAPEIS